MARTAPREKPGHQGYHISSDYMWIMRDSENLLWLPSEYRPWCSGVAGSTVAIGCASGRVLMITFRAEGPFDG
ncbi:hypothetical protein QBC46DRAFT_272617 [Diplogelasinospora grovesii]|uniref:Uncharacterized protein n=1 Tax=Diplogelasinospora grovesii TaxID=303347 RepID=A0AAN6MYU5_9PEZI|nr:hypothetical protein QBC46DRAFT_272617 [Diplogelasinospora grovesii]